MKIYLAPMEGVVDPVIRELYSKIGGFDQMTTEFIRVTHQLHSEKTFYKYCPELTNSGNTKYGTPVFVQLLGSDVNCLSENAARAVELSAPGIDLNFGCPAKKVNSHDGGASLLQTPERLFKIIQSVKKAVDGKVPVTAKVRLGYNDKSLHREIAEAVKSAEADVFTIHARTKLEGYKPPAHWEYIATMREIVSPMTTVANGEIWNLKDYVTCKEVSGCNDIAIGRGAFANPSLALVLKGQSKELSWGEIKTVILPEFIRLCIDWGGENYAVRRLKQWTKFLARQYPESSHYFESIKKCKSLNEIYVA